MSMNKKITKLLKEMPKYQIQDEAFENQNIARAQAYGRSSAVQMQEQNIEKGAAEAAASAKDVTSSTSGLLSTIAAINANQNNAMRGLAQDESAIQAQNTQQLQAANNAMIDEKDKAWRQNVYAPYDAKLRDLQRKKANRDRILADVGNGFMGALQSFVGGKGSSGSGSASGAYASYNTGSGGIGGGGGVSADQAAYSSNSRLS